MEDIVIIALIMCLAAVYVARLFIDRPAPAPPAYVVREERQAGTAFNVEELRLIRRGGAFIYECPECDRMNMEFRRDKAIKWARQHMLSAHSVGAPAPVPAPENDAPPAQGPSNVT